MKQSPDQIPRKVRKKIPSGGSIQLQITRRDLELRKSITMTQLSSIKEVKYIWFFHGTSDNVVPYYQASQLRECVHHAVASDIILIPHANHTFRSPLGKKGLEPLIEQLVEKVFRVVKG
eukprot:Gregarina_sp_Poly_1__10951@NODE_861_length_5941_cov_137_911474_g623_i0_p6_GENE_NODE_861_length_5941_cov_137_911474_g623_i0NODE_861_length_5941_cov_137_911474_g623_i0_p6_ORF_typecomplete_len119_score2_36Peptidase_S9/PF00326_21/3_7e05Abhydrolase_2/PF02230_16/0_002Hydrolase_4/PF12146_8/0_011DLH/PF01738_18/0_057UPF0227/PF05728_12/0_063DUF1749/PF08538_10/0_098Abhydrolase_1/PF00561_20/0_13_NODE_861_length_5941_cov_137_911474_g623_i034893845